MTTLLGHWPLGEQNILQYATGNTGAATPTTVDVTLPATTTAGSTVIIAISTITTITTPAGFVSVSDINISSLHLAAYRRYGVAGGEGPTWTITIGAASSAAWFVIELAGVRDLQLSVASDTNTTGTVASVSTSSNVPADTVHLAFFASKDLLGQEVTWDDYTGGFAELTDTCTTKGSASNVALSAGRLFPAATGQYDCAATQTQSCPSLGLLIAYQGTQWNPNVVANTGFETGTLAGIATGIATAKIFDTATNTAAMSIVTGRGGAGSACRLNRTASGSLEWDTNTLGAGFTTIVERVWVKVDSATGTPALMGITTAAAVSAVVSYVAATGKIRVQVGSGATVDSVEAPGLGVWFRVELYYRVDGTQYPCQWLLNGVTQTTAQSQTGVSATTIAACQPVGWSDAVTVDATYDDIAVSMTLGDYPLGDGRGILLKTDTAGTVTLSGTAANFNTFTANGTLAAWNATTARDAIDEVPPTIGASADGFCQITLAAGDYVEIPLTTYTLVGLEQVNALRMLACGWAASTTAATISFRTWDGSQVTTLYGTGDPAFDNSTTAPAWVAKEHPLITVSQQVWPQSWLDALVLRVGYSGDATPDIGVHAVYIEADIRNARKLEPLFGLAPDIYAIRSMDPATDGTDLVEVTTPADYGAVVTYTLVSGGGPVEVTVAAATTWQHPVGGDAPPIDTIALRPN